MFDYLILNNGSQIYDVKNDSEITINCFDKILVTEISNHYKEIATQIDFCTLRNYYIYKGKIKSSKKFLVPINDFGEINENIVKMNIFIDNKEFLDENVLYIKNRFNNVNVVKMIDTDRENSPIWITINPKGINKINTLKELCKKIHISIDEVIFFGDGENDLSIINEVGLGVAMGNALDVVKKHANYVTLSNDEEGIVYFLNNMDAKE